MVSLLWKACSEGDLQKVQELLDEPSGVDIELKDYTGVTPLIEAVKNGHVEVVRLLLNRGADPTNASKDGRPETYTSEPAILQLVQDKMAITQRPTPQPSYHPDTTDDPEKHYYAAPPPPIDPYMYYPPINHPLNEGGTYYPPPPPTAGLVSPNNGIGHLPPPEIARMIPCRYFPACRYGSQCIFLHPQGPYFPGGMQPYPMGNPYGPYYHPPPFQQPPPISPNANPNMHNRTTSEVVSPVQPPFSPNGVAPPPPGSYGPPVYPPPGQVPVQFPIPPPPPPHPQPPSHPGPHSPSNLYSASSVVTPYPVHPDGSYPPPGPLPNGHYPDPAPGKAVENSPIENLTNGVNGIGHHRRGSMRRQSFGSRKPPCLFFPSGRCKNGDECRFPHILPDGVSQSTFPLGKANARPPRAPQVNGQGTLADKLSNLNLRDDQRPRNGIEGLGNGHRPKVQPNGRHHHASGLNGHNKKSQPLKQQTQRVPNADEFPVLAGSITPPKLVNGHSGQNGLTAAQVLQAPPPLRKDVSKESSPRETTPEPGRGNISKDPKTEVPPAPEQLVCVAADKHPVMSFAAAAAAADAVKEVSVSA